MALPADQPTGSPRTRVTRTPIPRLIPRNLRRILHPHEGRVPRFSESRCVFSQSVALTREGPPSDVSAWRAVVRVLRSTARGPHRFDSLSAVLFPSDCRVCGLPLARFSLLPICYFLLERSACADPPLCIRCGEALTFDPDPDDASPSAAPAASPLPILKRPSPTASIAEPCAASSTCSNTTGWSPSLSRLGALLAQRIHEIPGLPQNPDRRPRPPLPQKTPPARLQPGRASGTSAPYGVCAGNVPPHACSSQTGLLERQRATESQAGLTPHQRRANVRGAFFVPHPETMKGRDVLLIDDIYTTGATARACATALKRAGAAHVWVATVARAQKEFATATDCRAGRATHRDRPAHGTRFHLLGPEDFRRPRGPRPAARHQRTHLRRRNHVAGKSWSGRSQTNPEQIGGHRQVVRPKVCAWSTTQALQTPVLVLNASYEPINICGARRALVLVLKGVARTEEEQATELHSARLRMAMPSVIRLLEYRRIPHQTRALSRKNILLRDRNTCQYCGILLPSAELTLDHVVPRSRGGASTWENLVAACHSCNRRKGNHLLARNRSHEAAARAPPLQPPHQPPHHAHDRPRRPEVAQVPLLLTPLPATRPQSPSVRF